MTDVVLDRDGAEWPPRLNAMERAEIMRPEAMRSERQLLEEPVQGAHRRHLLVSACTCPVFGELLLALPHSCHAVHLLPGRMQTPPAGVCVHHQ